MKTCKDCIHFIGGGIWSMCCTILPWIRHEDTPACESFEEREATDESK